jgi:hypothetical protein
MGTQNRVTYVSDLGNQLMTRNASDFNHRSGLFGPGPDKGTVPKFDAAMKTSKSHLTLKSNNSRDFRVNRIDTYKPLSKNLITKKQHDANIEKAKKGVTATGSGAGTVSSRPPTSKLSINPKGN